jgi:dTDP-glucose 4,6-dehydratase
LELENKNLNKTVLITGAAGFIGSHLCDKFIHEGFNVIAMDNQITGLMSNIEHLLPHPNFTYYQHDITNYIHIPGALDYILHFASPASPVDYLKYPIQTLKVGAIGTYNLLGLAKAKGSTILVASTSEVYGDPLVHPQSESYWGNVNCVGPRGVYDEAKRYQEAITMAYHQTHGLDTRIVRIFNTYGPKMRLDDGRVMPSFIKNALKNEPLIIYGDGNQTRSFCYINDTVNAIYNILFLGYHQPINIGSDEEISINNLAQQIAEILNFELNVIYESKRIDDPIIRRPCIKLAKELLGWQPKIPLYDGIHKTLQYYIS